MTYAIRIHQTGGADVLQWEEVADLQPAAGQLKLRQTTAGFNFADIGFRTGGIPAPLPAVLGLDGVGMVEAIGEGVTDFSVGDRVGYSMLLGAYAEMRLIPAERAIKLPDDLDDRTVASLLCKGLTARYLIRDLYKIQSGETILVHAAAGGVGTLLCQWAAALGATVIGTVSSDQKAAFARANGCAHTLIHGRDDLVERVKEITDGAKLPVVYDSIGKDTFMASLDCLQPRGLMVNFGRSSGSIGAFPIDILSPKGSLMLTSPTVATFIATRPQLLSAVDELFDAVRSGKIKPAICQTLPLREAVTAHRDVESRKTTGSTVFEI